MRGGKESLPLSPRAPGGCWPQLWPELEEVSHTLPPPAPGTSDLVTLP